MQLTNSLLRKWAFLFLDTVFCKMNWKKGKYCEESMKKPSMKILSNINNTFCSIFRNQISQREMTQFKVINIGADLQEKSIHWKDFMLHFLYPVMQSHSSLLLDCTLSCFKGKYHYKVHRYFKFIFQLLNTSLNHIKYNS